MAKIITRAILDWNGNILEEDSYEYVGPLALGKDSGSAPQPTDPYQQANAQYGLATGTANYNAALNRTDSSNSLGSNSWQQTGTDPNTGAPTYAQNTSLSPWANQMLSSPIDTSGVPGMPGGPNVSQNDYAAQQANYNQQMAYLQPQEQLQTEQQNSQLANEGITPGSAAYGQAQDQLGRQQTFSNQQAADSAIGAGNQEEATLYGLGGQSLQNQLAVRNAPISEYEQLQGNPSAQVSAATPDISGAFGQQYQGALAGYNANTATNNANTGAATSAIVAAMMY